MSLKSILKRERSNRKNTEDSDCQKKKRKPYLKENIKNPINYRFITRSDSFFKPAVNYMATGYPTKP